MTLRVLAFARIREILGESERRLDLAAGARVADAWRALVAQAPQLEPLAASTRIARNGSMTTADEPLADGDELALLPPSGGG